MKDNILLPYIEVNPKKTPIASVIWLHGLGADGHDFENIVPELKLPDNLPVRFIFPHAPERPITINQGYVMRAWYDVEAIDVHASEDEKGIRESAEQLCTLIENEKKRGIPADHIILAGFSQGGAIALHAGLRYPKKLAGILALSTYVPLATTLQKELSQENKTTRIFMAHGVWDSIIPINFAQASCELLKRLGYSLSWHEYAMDHSLCAEEIVDIGAWMKKLYLRNSS